MSLKQILVNISNNLPEGLRFYLKKTRSNMFRESIIENWRKKGCPDPPPHENKQQAIIDLQKQYQCDVLVETGTFRGDMIAIQQPYFKTVYSIELNEMFWQKAKSRFTKQTNIKLLLGDSGVVLHQLTPTLTEKTLFWLDGHFSGGDTALGDSECPIYNELDAIFDNNAKQHIILIDDARCFDGTHDYPKLSDLEAYINKKDNGYYMTVKDDLIKVIPR